MAYGDRFNLSVKDFGRKVLITVNRGKIVSSRDGKTATITYTDSPGTGTAKLKVAPAAYNQEYLEKVSLRARSATSSVTEP
jgi:hypothetical protein